MPDIRDSLAALDQRLADLRTQIADLAHAPEPAPPPPPPAPRPLPPPTPAGLDDQAGDLADQPAGPPASPGGQALADGVSRLGSQIEDLLRMRERLVTDARDLLRRYERHLDELEAQDHSDIQAVLASLLDPMSAPAARDEDRGGLPSGGPAELSSRPAFFEGVVTMTVAGASRIQTIQVLEDSLSRVGHVEQVYIRRWHAGALWLELSMSAGVELLGELNRVLPFAFAVQSATAQEIIISLEGER